MNDRFIDDLKNRVDLIEIAGKYAQLKKSGKNFTCRSPFRNERTPSFSISQEKQVWYDFGASEGGDVISFVEKAENLSFGEAVEFLAERAGIEVPKSFGENKVTQKEKKDIFTLHQTAANFFAKALTKNKEAQTYLADRKITPEVCKKWQIGYGGDAADGLSKYLREKGFSEKDILNSGVAFERDFGDKSMLDRFFGRIILPIFEPREGKIIAFSGRIMPGVDGSKKTAKYINSPENPVYHKSSTLFGLDRARKEISNQESVILVEGNFDVISAHEAGFVNTVATCGTSLTEDHLRILKRSTTNFYLAFDSDIAGKKATLRSAEMIWQMKLNPFIVEIIGGKDFDDLAREDKEKLTQAIKSAQPAFDFLLEKFYDKFCGQTKNLETEKKFLDNFFYFLKMSPRPIEIDDFLQKIAQKLNRDKNVIKNEFINYCKNAPTTKEKFIKETVLPKFKTEEYFIGFLSGFWNFFADKLNDKILEIFSKDSEPCRILKKKMANEILTEDEKNKLTAWELHTMNEYSADFGEKNLTKEFKSLAAKLRDDKIKKERIEQAKNLKF